MNGLLSQTRAERDAPVAHERSMAAQAAAKAANDVYTQGTWRAGAAGGSIVTDSPGVGCGPMDAASRAFYGGYVIAESITPGNRRRILACVNACATVPTEVLEACASWADIVKAPLPFRQPMAAEAREVGAALDPESIEQGDA